ncbi:hypothetical protein GCM10019998_23800 [Tetragenococcus solitarius]|uniref:Uncharacterized protein n=1 Tax=Tetragenococcus solitarius TaxID=71453 RepID=A0ABP6KXU4_9ENTE
MPELHSKKYFYFIIFAIKDGWLTTYLSIKSLKQLFFLTIEQERQ